MMDSLLSGASWLRTTWRTPALWLLAALTGLGYASFHVLPVLDPPHALGHVLLMTGLYALYLLAAWLGHDLKSRWQVAALVGAGLLFRLLLLPLDPSMSDDLYRYLWDGRMQAMGINPYALAPQAPFLAPLADAHIQPLINHPNIRTLYPPLAQLLFYLSYLLHPSGYLGLKALLWVAECCTLGLLALWLRHHKLPQGRLLLYAWCPLPIFELMVDGHLDGFGSPFLLALLLAVKFRRPWTAGVIYALGLLVKPLGIFVGPLLLWQTRWRGFLKVTIAAAAVFLILMAPYLAAGKIIVQQIAHYSKHWYFNGPIFIPLYTLTGASEVRTVLTLAVIGFAWLVPFVRGLTWEQRFLLPLFAYMMMTPTLYPWYLVWLAPWLVMTPSAALFWLFGAISWSHSVHLTLAATGIWRVHPLIFALEFVPLALLLAWHLRRYLQRQWPVLLWFSR